MNPINPEGQRPERRNPIPFVVWLALGLLVLEGIATSNGGIRKEDLLLTFIGAVEIGIGVYAFGALASLRR